MNSRNRLAFNLQRIAVFRALHLGDLLCVIPAIRALKHAYPGTQITLLGHPWAAEFARRFGHYFSAFSSFPGFPGLPEQSFELDAYTVFVRRERATGYDLLLQMHGKGSITNSIVAMLGARYMAGFFEPGEFCPDPQRFMPYPEGISEVHRHLKLMEFLGVPSRGTGLEFPLTDADWTELDVLQREFDFDAANSVCIHPGARDVRRWWAPQKFARIADAVAAMGFDVVFTGTAAEAAAVDGVRQRMRTRSISLVGRTGLGALGALIARTRLVISNDTGISHVAAATRTPSIVVFLASDPARWAPLNRDLHRVVLPKDANDISRVMLHAEQMLARPAQPSLSA